MTPLSPLSPSRPLALARYDCIVYTAFCGEMLLHERLMKMANAGRVARRGRRWALGEDLDGDSALAAASLRAEFRAASARLPRAMCGRPCPLNSHKIRAKRPPAEAVPIGRAAWHCRPKFAKSCRGVSRFW